MAMTETELEEQVFEHQNHIADRFKDIQTQSQQLKNPDDEYKTRLVLTKIKDAIDDIERSYMEIDSLRR